MRAYVVLVYNKYGGVSISQEAYSSLEDAHKFVKSRAPIPGRLSLMRFRDDEGREYVIHDLRVIEPKEVRKRGRA